MFFLGMKTHGANCWSCTELNSQPLHASPHQPRSPGERIFEVLEQHYTRREGDFIQLEAKMMTTKMACP